MKCRVHKKQIIEIGDPPKVFAGIMGFNNLPDSEQRKYGWFPFEGDDEPDHDPRTQSVRWDVEFGDVVRSRARVVDLTEDERAHVLAERREALLSELAALRWEHQTAGVEYAGVRLHTDPSSVMALRMAAQEGEGDLWKGMDSQWITLSPGGLLEASQRATTHVRDCFAREAELAHAIRKADHDALDELDMTQGWP